MKTAEQYFEATGHMPVQDDLERANCPKAGEIMHVACGWCDKHDKPKAECMECWTSTSKGVE
jgi:hypothetical protein